MIAWALANMAWASAVMLLVLAIRKPFAARLGAGSAYALWLLPAARLVMPPLPHLPASIAQIPAMLPPVAHLPSMMLGIPLAKAAVANIAMPIADKPDVPWLIMLWVAGTILFVIWQLCRHHAFVRRLHAGARNRGTHKGLQLIESAAVDGPLALGLLDRRIVLPTNFDRRYSREERHFALAHEAIHHQRGDIWWNHAALVLLAINWFNPIAWISFRAFRTDQELACDARVIATASLASREYYARALVKSASRPGLIAACALNHAGQLKCRLKMMRTHRSCRSRSMAGGATIAALGGVMVVLATPGIAQQTGLAIPTRDFVLKLNPANFGTPASGPDDISRTAVPASMPRAGSWAGRWTFQVPHFVTDQGVSIASQSVVLELNADGSGQVITGQHPAMTFRKARIEGAKVSFVMALTPDCPASRWVGEIKGGRLRLVSQDAKTGGWFDLDRANATSLRLAAAGGEPSLPDSAKTDAASLFHLGAIYATGHGVPQDKARALSLYRQAAEAGSAEAMLSLARAYDVGSLGLDYDEAEAANWYRRWAKASGDPGAAQMLAARSIQL